MSQPGLGGVGESGASVADDSAALLPCLKERTWSGREHSMCRVLWPNEASAYMPWVAVGYDHPQSFRFISTKDFGRMQTTEAALESRAVANLRRRPATWEKVDIEASKNAPGFTILAGMDDFLAAERILVPDFMNEAQRTLRARGLLVGIPRRGRLFCINGELSPQVIKAFGIMVAQDFVSGESAQISPMLFAVKDGAILAIVESIADAYLPELERERDEAPEDPNAPSMTVVTLGNDDGTEDVMLMVAGLDAAQFAAGLQHGFVNVLHKQLSRKEFSGRINVVVLAHTPDEVKVHLPEVMTHLRAYCDEVSKDTGKPIRVTLEHQESSWPATTTTRSGAAATPKSAASTAAATVAVPGAKPRQTTFRTVVHYLILTLVLVLFWQLVESYRW